MEQRGIRTERGDINRAIKKANEEIKNINAAILKLENELQRLRFEQRQDETELAETKIAEPISSEGYMKTDIAEQEKPKLQKQNISRQNILTATQQTAKADSTKKPTTETVTATATTKTAKSNPPQTPKSETKAKPIQTSKPQSQTKPIQKPKTLKEVNMEIEIVETKLQRLEHAETVIMLYNQKIEDIQRNLNSVGWWERRKMLKELSFEEQRRDTYEADAIKKYGTKPKLENKKPNCLPRKSRLKTQLVLLPPRSVRSNGNGMRHYSVNKSVTVTMLNGGLRDWQIQAKEKTNQVYKPNWRFSG